MRPKSLIYNWDSVPIVFDIPIMVKIIGKSYDTIKKMCQKGQIPAFKAGNEWRFRKDSIQKWIDDQETQSRKYA